MQTLWMNTEHLRDTCFETDLDTIPKRETSEESTLTATRPAVVSDSTTARDGDASPWLPMSASPTHGQFAELNWDCRRLCLEAIIRPSTVAVFLPSNFHHDAIGVPMPSMRTVSEQHGCEAQFVFVTATEFELKSVSSSTSLASWLRNMSFTGSPDIRSDYRNGFPAVRRLRFSRYSSAFNQTLPAATNSHYLELATECTGLREITIAIHAAHLTDLTTGYDLSLADLVRRNELNRLLRLPRLKVLRVTATNWQLANATPDVIQGMQWLETMFDLQHKLKIRKHAVKVVRPD